LEPKLLFFVKMTTKWKYITPVVDYCFLFLWVSVWSYVFGNLGWELHHWIFASIGFSFLCHVRELGYFHFMGDEIAQIKRDYSMTRRNWLYWLQTTVVYCTNMWILRKQGLIFYEPITLSLKSFMDVYVAFIIVQVLKDVSCMWVFHEKMHVDSKWMPHHQEHHTVGRNAQALMAFHIDLMDLFIENTGGPAIYLAGLWLCGQQPRIHVIAVLISSVMDVMVHSVNPYTVTFWNPLLDYFMNCNIAHQVHHSTLTANYTFIPYHHLFGGFTRDAQKYNEVMKTNFDFGVPMPAMKVA